MPGHFPLHTSLLFSLYQNHKIRYSGVKLKNEPRQKKQDKRCRKKIVGTYLGCGLKEKTVYEVFSRQRVFPARNRDCFPHFEFSFVVFVFFSCICICIFICSYIFLFVSVFVFVSSRQRVLPGPNRDCNFENFNSFP